MLSGWSGRNALYGGFLAKAGYTGIKQVFERPYGGWLSTFGGGQNPDSTQIAMDLGKTWEIKQEGIKTYAASGALFAALDALFDINAKRTLNADEIKSIHFDFAGSMYEHVWWPVKRPLEMTEAQLNMAYTAAVAVLDKAVLVHQFTPARIDSDDVWNLIPRISATEDKDFDKDTDPSHGFQSRVTVTFTDGTTLGGYEPAPKAVSSPVSNDDIVTKYHNLTDGIIDNDRRDRIQDMVLSLDKQPNLKGLFDLLAPPVNSPFAET
jgi:2-methylcitrate dehydratase PrpD